ncbi:hypothetical protein [Candidatus Sororendozoicomonas aggregata]|uniref:hypothetical protein n=1 Tax=Candidatus Sororendozoicomonas aggregata TaxID=3073239 RepID=UPI002ED583A0
MPFKLESGDVLFKMKSERPNMIPKLISLYSPLPLWLHYPGKRDLTKSLYDIDPCDLTHVAFSMGSSGLVEYDESVGLSAIAGFNGSGLVCTDQPDSTTHGEKKYVVLRPINKNLSEKAYRKTLSIVSCWDTLKTTSYGIRKVINTAIFHVRGASVDEKFIEETQSKLLDQFDSRVRTNRANFFCSEYIAFVYLWAALELYNNKCFGHPSSVFGTLKVRLTPAELFTRMLHHGQFTKIGYYEF